MKRINFKQLVTLLSYGIISFSQSISFSEPNMKTLNTNENIGKKYFEGSIRFKNGGPACISCHSVQNENVIYGGLLAKDLTDVYSRMNEGISSWLMAPSFPAMITAYKNNPLTENERLKLTEFFKYTNETKAAKNIPIGYYAMLTAGISGLILILIFISIIWFKRKKKMVKADIFKRQSKAWDAKH